VSEVTIRPAARPLHASLRMPGDKSISHRALLLGALAEGTQTITNLPDGDDVRATRRLLEALGVSITDRGSSTIVRGRGGKLDTPRAPLDCGDSGTTMRIFAGVLAGVPDMDATLIADASLSRRPMERIAEPLRRMGATVETTDGHAPVRVRGAKLRAIEHASEVASAQVKSCVLLAGLAAQGTTRVREPERSRDHTERMLAAMGVKIVADDSGLAVAIEGGQRPRAIAVDVPGDLSSAAFPIVAALVVPGSEVETTGVGLNPTRTGFLEALDAMGADVEVAVEGASGGEPYGAIVARGGRELRAVQLSGEQTVRAIDELPALFALAAFARGRSTFRDAKELRKKESDRIASMARGLRALGVACEELDDGLAVEGDPARSLAGARVDSAGDHRIAMALAAIGLRASSDVVIAGADAVAKSYPSFFTDLERART
jgi:3-phosphoshikimate 1-carboxyvinyltransferase